MSSPEDKTRTPAPAPRRGKTRGKSLTTAQKAEAAALWRTGSVTLADLSKRYGKTPEMFSRLFSRMGIKKGEGVAAAVAKAEEAISKHMVSDTEETLRRIAKVREDHFKMSQAIAFMAFKELQQTRAAEIDVGKLKDAMAVYKMVSDVVGNSRRELFEILNVEKHDKNEDLDDLPDLTVRELTQGEITALQDAPIDDLDGADLGEGMIDLEDDDD